MKGNDREEKMLEGGWGGGRVLLGILGGGVPPRSPKS